MDAEQASWSQENSYLKPSKFNSSVCCVPSNPSDAEKSLQVPSNLEMHQVLRKVRKIIGVEHQ